MLGKHISAPHAGRNGLYEDGLSLVWVTNPYLQKNSRQLDTIVSTIKANFDSVQLETYDIGDMARWYYLSSAPYLWSQVKFDIIMTVNEKITQMSLYPLTMSGIINKIMTYKAERINNVMEIITRWLYVSRGYDVTNVSIIYEQNPTPLLVDAVNANLPEDERLQYIDHDTIIMKMVPRLENGAPIYLEAADISHLLRNFDLNALLNYEYLSADELTEYAVRDDPYFAKYKKWNGLYLIPFGDPNNVIRQNRIILFEMRVQGLRQQQTYVTPKHARKFLTIHPSLAALPELGYMWQQKLLAISDTEVLSNQRYYMRSNINFGQSAEDFMQQSLNMLEKGKLPRFLVQGASTWQRVVTEYNEHNTLKLYYAAVRAMAKVLAANDLPLMVLDNLLVMPDYSIEVMLANYEQVKHFKQEFELLLRTDQDLKLAKQTVKGWTVYPVASVGRAGLRMIALHRYYWQLLDPKLTSLALQINGSDIVYLVVDTDTANYKRPTDDDVLELVDDLEEELQNYYSICEISQNLSGFFDATKATLDELLLLVPMNRDTNVDGSMGTQYCLSEDLISELIAATSTAATQAAMDEDIFRMFVDNPAIIDDSASSSTPLSQAEIFRAVSRSLGLRGFFTVGKLRGLLSALPDYTILRVDVGEISLSQTSEVLADEENGDNYNLYEVELALYSDDALYVPPTKATQDLGYIVPLFQIYLKKSDVVMMTQLINDLWEHGWFLNHWGKQLYRHTGKITRYMYVRDVRLNYGVDGITESNKVMSLLKRVHSHYT